MDTNAACVHYERNCNTIAPCCQRIYGCRICHDELSEPNHPDMNRFMVREVVCKNCHTQQAVSNQCIQCHTVFGEYHCNICNLWMSMVCMNLFVCCCCLMFVTIHLEYVETHS
jgi:RING finger/CHY zinc finger protein 1